MKPSWLRSVGETKKTTYPLVMCLSLSLLGLTPDFASARLATTPPATGKNPPDERLVFVTAIHCTGCHTGLFSQTGADISIATDWRSSMMANSARDPYWQASVRRETQDHPKAAQTIESACATCHMPMAGYQAHATGSHTTVFSHLPVGPEPSRLSQLAVDGVSCTLCHQIESERLQGPKQEQLRFVIDTTKPVGKRPSYGPYEIDSTAARIMIQASGYHPKQTPTIRQAARCGSCHTLYTHTLDDQGKTVNTLAEQMPYLEWLHGRYSQSHSCQDCHMPAVPGTVSISNVIGIGRQGVKQHLFRGGNFFMLGLLLSHREELGVQALQKHLRNTCQQTMQHLEKSSARLSLVDTWYANGRLQARIAVHNLAGHKLPSAYPSRRVWLHVVVRDATQTILFESGKLHQNGSIAGNNNDRDANTFEPHYTRIDSSDQVQIYEAILGAANGKPTTGLLTASVYFKDNRLLPQGFDKRTAVDDIAVRGAAMNDTSFAAGMDQVTYNIDVGAAKKPLTLEAELLYQPISYRWALNLSHTQASEIDRFVRYTKQTTARSAIVLTTLNTPLH